MPRPWPMWGIAMLSGHLSSGHLSSIPSGHLSSTSGHLSSPSGHRSSGGQAESADQLRRRALDLAYNLDQDEALALLRRAVTVAPDDPAPRRTLASVLWLRMLYS